jgi:fructokinase
METKYKVVGIGEVLWDLLPQGKVLGGAPANFAYHAHQLGAEGYMISSIGKDELGEEIVAQLNAYDIHLLLEKVDYPTGTVIVKLNELGVPEYEIIKNVAWDYLSLSPESYHLAGETDAVCFGSLAQRNEVTKRVITDFVKLVPAKALKIFDINLRQSFYSSTVIEDSLKLANILKINDDEVRIISAMFGWKDITEEEFCKRMTGTYGLKMVALTSGAKGSFLYTENEQSFLETPVVEVKDTVGAGDSFTAGLAMAYLKNKSLKECHSIAVELSAYVCTHNGATPEHPSYFKQLLDSESAG